MCVFTHALGVRISAYARLGIKQWALGTARLFLLALAVFSCLPIGAAASRCRSCGSCGPSFTPHFRPGL
eukprot:14786563-Alexandrium_andersonii.AAC.1